MHPLVVSNCSRTVKVGDVPKNTTLSAHFYPKQKQTYHWKKLFPSINWWCISGTWYIVNRLTHNRIPQSPSHRESLVRLGSM